MTIVQIVKRAVAYWNAKRDYRALCQRGMAPVLNYHIALIEDDPYWPVRKGIISIKTVYALTPATRRKVARDLKRMELIHVHQLMREAAERTEETE